MRLYALISAETQKVVDFYPTTDAAETALAECLDDEPEWAEVLRVEAVEFEASSDLLARNGGL
ncbi:MAG: hypothetical protein ACRD3V_11930 [Vicinamibacteria bacterium]